MIQAAFTFAPSWTCTGGAIRFTGDSLEADYGSWRGMLPELDAARF